LSPIDILASNFRDDPNPGQPDPSKAIVSLNDRSIRLVPERRLIWSTGRSSSQLSLLEFITLAGLEAHRCYWEPVFQAENTAFSLAIAQIYADDNLLV
jgi:hypothetical protein